MRIFVTGASGFIGSHLCRDLIRAGHELLALSRETQPWRLADLTGRFTLLRGGLDDQPDWAHRLEAFAPEAVVHLAWNGVAGSARNSPAQARNIVWTTDLLERSARCGARAFVGTGSQAEYGGDPDLEKPEKPTTVYGEAKLSSGRMGAAIARELGIRFAWIRIFSVFGPMDHPHWLIPGLIRDLLRGQTPALTGGEQLWDFLSVVDAARAVRLVVESEGAAGIFPLGSGEAPPLRATIEALRDRIDPRRALDFGRIPYRPDQVMLLRADIRRLRALGWRPEIPLAQGLGETVQWYRANPWIFQ